jgi:hypothetical protein
MAGQAPRALRGHLESLGRLGRRGRPERMARITEHEHEEGKEQRRRTERGERGVQGRMEWGHAGGLDIFLFALTARKYLAMRWVVQVHSELQ